MSRMDPRIFDRSYSGDTANSIDGCNDCERDGSNLGLGFQNVMYLGLLG